MKKFGVLGQIAITAVTYWSLGQEVSAIPMSSTTVPELSNELAQIELQSNDGPVGSLAQTHALSSLPQRVVNDKGGLLKHRQYAIDFYDKFSQLLNLLNGPSTPDNDGTYVDELAQKVIVALDNAPVSTVFEIEQLYLKPDEDGQ